MSSDRPFAETRERFHMDRPADSSKRRARAKSVPTPMAPPVESERALARVFRDESLGILARLTAQLVEALPDLIDEGRAELGKPPIEKADGHRIDVAWSVSSERLIGTFISVVDQARAARGLPLIERTDDARRFDALKKVARVSNFIGDLELQYAAEFDEVRARAKIETVDGKLRDVNSGRWASNIKQTAIDSTRVPDQLGAFIIDREPTIPTAVSNRFIKRATQMIRAEGTPRVLQIPRKHFRTLERTVRISVHRGVRPEETIKAISKIEGVTERRAEVIARDQVGKYNGEVTRVRNKQLGLNRYRWRHVGDDAVRVEHRLREGKIFSYDKPPFDGNPGEPVQCRCWAEPVLEDVLGDFDE